ncbi:glycosyltransferase [Pelagibacteraceae bacterium]|jgi:dolichyl-phosphate beta-glucosyltransferase|nr:glycosyltransferase [Pelagibacteraceae bacterium]
MKITELSIIFPIFNEEARLVKNLNNVKKLFKSFINTNIEIILVNDGSNDKSHEIIKKFLKSLGKKKNKKIKYICYKQNKGKGFALKEGIKNAKKKWHLTCDIDFSANPTELKKWERKKLIRDTKSCYFASRSLKESTVKYKHHRYYLGNIFNNLVSFIFDLNIGDTQCGFKLYHKTYSKRIFLNLKEYRYSHDVEIALLLKKSLIKIVELPILWTHKDKSKLNIFSDGINMILKLLFIKIRY